MTTANYSQMRHDEANKDLPSARVFKNFVEVGRAHLHRSGSLNVVVLEELGKQPDRI